MKKQIVIRYKWNGRSEEKWLFWLKKKLLDLQCEVLMLPILDSDFSRNKNWLSDAQAMHGISESETYFVEHDPGCLTVLKYIERLVKIEKAEPALLVAGFNLSRGEASAEKSITLYQGGEARREDVRLIVLYGGSLGRLLENPEKLFLK